MELVEDVACENTQYAEIRFCPHLHTNENISSEQALEAVLDGVKIASAKHGVIAKVIVCCIRNMSDTLSLEMAKLASRYANEGVVGFDVAGDEVVSPLVHKQALTVAQKAGLGITIHTGEISGRRTIEDALLFADRIGHGCTLIDHPFMLERVIERNIAIECCPTSNFQTRAIADLNHHPLKDLLKAGARVTINTDNRLVSKTSLVQELALTQFKLRLSDSDMLNVIDNAFKARFF
jgi:adenosine deaminase